MTAKQRIERTVQQKRQGPLGVDAVNLILTERARLKRKVRQLRNTTLPNTNQLVGYQLAIGEILQFWEE